MGVKVNTIISIKKWEKHPFFYQLNFTPLSEYVIF